MSEKKIHIVLAMDEPYWHKAKEYGLFDSIEKNTKETPNIYIKCLCFGFNVPESDNHFNNENWDWARCEIGELKSFRTGFPSGKNKTRNFFICAEGGEFLDYFEFDPSDVIVHIDADTTMQRPFTEYEINLLREFKDGEVGSSYHAIPVITLEQEIKSLKIKEPERNILKHFPRHWNRPIFCTGLIVATAKTYRDTIYNQYLSRIDKMVMLFDHHAGGQWLMSYIVYEYATFFDLGRVFAHADWFIGSDRSDVIDNKFCYKGQVVLFNHHKFNKVWDF